MSRKNCVASSARASLTRGFTLVELLVVIAIIGTLVALLLPAVQAAREAARRNSCQNNLKQFGLAIQNHHDTKKFYPAGRMQTDQFGTSWAFDLLPFMENGSVYSAFQKGKAVFDKLNAAAMRTPLPVYACPSRRSPAADRDFDNNDAPVDAEGRGVATPGDYAACAGKEYMNGIADRTGPDGKLKADLRPDLAESGAIFSFSKTKEQYVTDGLSNTLVVGDKNKAVVEQPENPDMRDYEQGDTSLLACDTPHTIFGETQHGLASGQHEEANFPEDRARQQIARTQFGSEHPETVQFVFLDGHVKAIVKSLEAPILTLLGCIGDDQIIPEGTL